MCLDTINTTTKFSPALRRCNPAGVKRDEFASAGGEVEEHPPHTPTQPLPGSAARCRQPRGLRRSHRGMAAAPPRGPAPLPQLSARCYRPSPARPDSPRPRSVPVGAISGVPPPHGPGRAGSCRDPPPLRPVPSPEGRGSVPPRRVEEVEEGGGGDDDLLGVGGIPIDGV